MKNLWLLSCVLAAAALSGCGTLMNRPTGVASIPCTYRFKMVSRAEDQSRVEAAIHTVAVGSVVKGGTPSYPEYRFRVARLADLDTLHPKLLFCNSDALFASGLKQTLNVRSAGVDMTFDSTDVSASATTLITFNVKPGSRLYYKNPGGVESDITAKVDKAGKVNLPVTIKEGQKYIFARAMKDHVVRYIRINIFSSQVQDISKREY
jgi:uncharacterized protein YceK